MLSPGTRVSEVSSSLERLKGQNAEKSKTIETLTQKLEAVVRAQRLDVGQGSPREGSS